jgi:hypothetical protein
MNVAIFSEELCTHGSLYKYVYYNNRIQLAKKHIDYANWVEKCSIQLFLEYQNLGELDKFMGMSSSFKFIIFHCFKSKHNNNAACS